MNQKTNKNTNLAKEELYIKTVLQSSRQESMKLTLGNSAAIKQIIKELL